jgi:hypothetical protein
MDEGMRNFIIRFEQEVIWKFWRRSRREGEASIIQHIREEAEALDKHFTKVISESPAPQEGASRPRLVKWACEADVGSVYAQFRSTFMSLMEPVFQHYVNFDRSEIEAVNDAVVAAMKIRLCTVVGGGEYLPSPYLFRILR